MARKSVIHRSNSGHEIGCDLHSAAATTGKVQISHSSPFNYDFKDWETNSPATVHCYDTSNFEFHKGPIKSTPSKWEDAEKWLVSRSPAELAITRKSKSGPLQRHEYLHFPKRVVHAVPERDWPCDSDATQNVCRRIGTRVITNAAPTLLVSDSGHPAQSFDFSWERVKKVESLNDARHGLQTLAFVSSPMPPPKAGLNHSFDCYPVGNEQDFVKEVSMSHEGRNDESFSKLRHRRTEKPSSEGLISAASYLTPAQAVHAVAMRDMGTEMTPVASQAPSQTGTPLRATTPTMGSPVSSGPPSPKRATPMPSPMCDSENVFICDGYNKTSALGEKEIYRKTRRGLQVLGRKLGKLNISAWASKEEEDADAFESLNSIDFEEVKKNVLKTRAAAWEEAEHAKYMARFKREEAKIKAWEVDKKVKAESEMRRIEVETKKTLSHAQKKLMNKVATARHRAEELHAAAEAKHGEQVAKTAVHADHIRRTGRMPSSFFGCGLCH